MPNYYNYNPVGLNPRQIDEDIQRLQNIRNNYNQQLQQPVPVQNIINTNQNPIEMEARFLKENETADTILINNKTLFIDEKNSKIYIKETNGDISKTYDIVVPKSKEEIKIEELTNNNTILTKKLEELEAKVNEQHISTNTQIGKSTGNDTKLNTK